MPGRTPRGRQAGASGAAPRAPASLFLGFALFVVLLVTGIVAWNRVRTADEIVSQRSRLAALSLFRQTRVESWLRERKADAALAARFPSVQALFQDGPEHGDHIEGVLDLLARAGEYLSVLVVDPSGRILAGGSGRPEPRRDVLAPAVRSVVLGAPLFTDIRADEQGRQRMVFASPVEAPAPGDPSGPPTVVGAVVLLVDPSSALYPLLSNGGAAGETGEVVLAQPGPGGLVAVTPLRTGGRLGSSVLASPIPRPASASGEVSLSALDYRGVEVLASARSVSGSDWLVVAKLDMDEALEPVRAVQAWVAVAALAAIAALGLLVFALGRHYRARHFEVLAMQEARYRALAENARDLILILAPDGTVVEANRAALEAYGMHPSELIGENAERIRAPGQSPALGARIREALESEVFYETVHQRRDGSTFPVEISARGVDFGGQRLVIAIVRDITERRRLEHQSVLAQRMEALGRLAGGVAHDFNNLLTAIRGYATLVQDSMDPSDPRRGDLEEVIRAADRASNLTRQLLAFSRRQVTESRVIDLNGLVHDLEKMLRRLIGEDVVLQTELAQDPLWIRSDPSQIENVLVNLVVNARDAMPGGGRLLLRTQPLRLRDPDAPAPDHVRMTVEDSGTGMTADVKARAFEPFFTTKEPGKGTGLGLSSCYGIIKQHDGQIWLDSEPGQGTRVHVDLPLVDEPPPATLGTAPGLRAAGGSEAILLAEDDPGVRAFTALVLRALGYTVHEAGSGPEALSLVTANPDLAVDLLVTDVVMPSMSGVQLRNQLRRLRPELRALFVSGYAESSMFEMGGVEPDAPVLRKPFTPDEIARKVREVLGM